MIKLKDLSSGHKYWLIVYGFSAMLFGAFHYLFELEFFTHLGKYVPTLQNLSLAFCFISIIMLIQVILEILISKTKNPEGDQYNLKRVSRLIALSLSIFIFVSFMFQKPYTTLASLGLVSLVLGFALQAPITSFIAWLYIILRQPYQVGDRIQIGETRGDVVEIGYLDTIIKEVSGDYLGNDRISGRLIYFPNSIILTGKVINYSGDFGMFIWDETSVQISYTSDLKFVESCLMEAASRDFKDRYPNKSVKGIVPSVYFRVNRYAWMEAVVSYPVEPTDTTGKRNRILRYAVPLLNSQPEKVGFPEGSRR